ncbi:ATP-binding protein, partial [Enterococcus faecalis]
LETEKMFNDSLKARAINYLKYSSLYTDKNLINCRFKTYKTVDTETKLAFEIANRATTEILLNKPIHMILSGKSGVGKSHLAMSTAWEVLEKSNYDKRCLFISYAELLEQLKFAMKDEQARKTITGTLMAEIKSADLVVLDDLGAELGVKGNDSTNFNNDTLNRIVEARQNKATVFTTNLTGKEMRQAYGERILSRIMSNSQGFVMTIEGTSDKRVAGI